jgi:hypothetical protein
MLIYQDLEKGRKVRKHFSFLPSLLLHTTKVLWWLEAAHLAFFPLDNISSGRVSCGHLPPALPHL